MNSSTEGPRRRAASSVSRNGVKLLRRGVWQAPFFGDNGEMVLVAVRRDGRILGEPVTVPHGASRIDAAEALLARLDTIDPLPDIRIV